MHGGRVPIWHYTPRAMPRAEGFLAFQAAIAIFFQTQRSKDTEIFPLRLRVFAFNKNCDLERLEGNQTGDIKNKHPTVFNRH